MQIFGRFRPFKKKELKKRYRNLSIYCFRSKILEQVVCGYREGEEKRIYMGEFSTEAVQQFIKFLYGFELEEEEEEKKNWKNDLEFIKELIILGGVYSVSDFQTAAAPYLALHLNAGNAAELGEFSAAHSAQEAGRLCKRVLDYEEHHVLMPLVVIQLIIALLLLSYVE